MKLGLVTYNMAKDWDIPTIIEKCVETGFAGVELRTTHAHGVEVELSASERAAVKQQFDDSPIEIAGLGSAFDYHSVDQDAVRQNIEGTKVYSQLAADVGAPGVKVRPNGLPSEVPVEKTLEQIGLALRECGEFAADLGVQIRLEVHGGGTSELRHIRTIIDVADHENVYVCWNSNFGEVENGTIKNNFDLVKRRIGLVHITELHRREYPWRELFTSLKVSGYTGYTLAEIAGSSDPVRVMNFYRALWEELVR
ncbi:sugar phosphate isomerase/epimerase [Candidatus Poribacteria bacterium]|nr:sugar phosphate isomerase/epimerase [Candidatus Poribacteria bacterium]MYG08632.1 sugar phosphate isomerase/epimerase [Candidatus Poribacteria bacterium]MYK22182.1 sugar phosphate isomerase/epimerase [Candidatus Poribacteria bacterium]